MRGAGRRRLHPPLARCLLDMLSARSGAVEDEGRLPDRDGAGCCSPKLRARWRRSVDRYGAAEFKAMFDIVFASNGSRHLLRKARCEAQRDETSRRGGRRAIDPELELDPGLLLRRRAPATMTSSRPSGPGTPEQQADDAARLVAALAAASPCRRDGPKIDLPQRTWSRSGRVADLASIWRQVGQRRGDVGRGTTSIVPLARPHRQGHPEVRGDDRAPACTAVDDKIKTRDGTETPSPRSPAGDVDGRATLARLQQRTASAFPAASPGVTEADGLADAEAAAKSTAGQLHRQ